MKVYIGDGKLYDWVELIRIQKIVLWYGLCFFCVLFYLGGVVGFFELRIVKKIKNKSQVCKEFVEFIYIGIIYFKNMLKIKKKIR